MTWSLKMKVYVLTNGTNVIIFHIKILNLLKYLIVQNVAHIFIIFHLRIPFCLNMQYKMGHLGPFYKLLEFLSNPKPKFTYWLFSIKLKLTSQPLIF